MKRILRDERGMALALAIVALVIVGALVAGALFSGMQEQRAAENSRRVLQAFGVAEEEAYDVINQWNTQVYNGQKVYPLDSTALVTGWPTTWANSANQTGVYGGYVYRLNGQQYLVDVTARDLVSYGNAALQQEGGGGRERLGLLVRNKPFQFAIKAALTTGNGDAVGGNSTISGIDQSPTNWAGCGPTGNAVGGIRAASGDVVTISGSAHVTGNPPVIIDTSVHASTFDTYYNLLVSMANITIPATTFATAIAPALNASGQCDRTVSTNWGDPLNPTLPCGNYFPIIHITGTGATTTINGTEGQGILLVDGTLAVQGGFQFYGITIVKGSLKTAGAGTSPAHFWGATMVQDSVQVGTNTLTGSANLLYSTCTIQTALNRTAPGVMMRSRGWVPLF
ncbi:MAG TPA: pilus assembly PilX N-terminal domain-containing protein [Gemmatimonadales bacterium]|nr:pilus assembly PilX N-terminal domain-containing protein [Gemmatimonadales bacterium]